MTAAAATWTPAPMAPSAPVVDTRPYRFRVGLGHRLAAYLLDWFIAPFVAFLFGTAAFVLCYVLGFLVGVAYPASNDLHREIAIVFGMFGGATIGAMVSAVVFLGTYFACFMMEAFSGWSPGRQFVGIQIARADGSPASMWRLLVRFFTKFLGLGIIACGIAAVTGSEAAFQLICGLAAVSYLGILLALLPRKQALHDLIAGTAVFRREALR